MNFFVVFSVISYLVIEWELTVSKAFLVSSCFGGEIGNEIYQIFYQFLSVTFPLLFFFNIISCII